MSQQPVDHFSPKPELSGLRNRKMISGVVEGKSPTTEYDSVWSPTSPLDFRLFSSFANPFGSCSSSRLFRKRKQKSWDSEKVGLSLVDSPDDSSKSVLTRSGNPKCPKPQLTDVVVDDLPVDVDLSFPLFGKVPVQFLEGVCSANGDGLGAGNINSVDELVKSEAYTCVIKHGSNPKTTHYFGTQVLEVTESGRIKLPFRGDKKKESIFSIEPLELTSDVFPSGDFLSYCWLCRKDLFGKDIYMYRHRAFCSIECRAEEIWRDEMIEGAAKAKAKEEGYEAGSESGSVSDKDMPKKKGNRAFVTRG